MTARPRTARWPLVIVSAIPIGVLVSCSLPTEERVTPYGPNELSPALVETTTTTTSTTTSTTVPSDATAPDVSTSSTTPVDTVPVLFFYTVGSFDQMQPLRRSLPTPVPLEQVISQLEAPTDLEQLNLRTSVRIGLIEGVEVERATATVRLDEAILDRMSETEKRRAIAQIVLTLTSFQPPNVGNIGFVLFEVDGDGYPVFVPALGGSSEPGQELAHTDFATMVVGTPSTTTSTTSTTTTTPPSTAA